MSKRNRAMNRYLISVSCKYSIRFVFLLLLLRESTVWASEIITESESHEHNAHTFTRIQPSKAYDDRSGHVQHFATTHAVGSAQLDVSFEANNTSLCGPTRRFYYYTLILSSSSSILLLLLFFSNIVIFILNYGSAEVNRRKRERERAIEQMKAHQEKALNRSKCRRTISSDSCWSSMARKTDRQRP